MSTEHYIGHASRFFAVYPSTSAPPYQHYHVVVDGDKTRDYLTTSDGAVHEEGPWQDTAAVRPMLDEFIRSGSLVPATAKLLLLERSPVHMVAQAAALAGLSDADTERLTDAMLAVMAK